VSDGQGWRGGGTNAHCCHCDAERDLNTAPWLLWLHLAVRHPRVAVWLGPAWLPGALAATVPVGLGLAAAIAYGVPAGALATFLGALAVLSLVEVAG